MKFIEERPFQNPDVAARKLIEIANAAETVQDGRIYIERINELFLAAGGSPGECRAGLDRAISTSAMPRERWRVLLCRTASHRARIGHSREARGVGDPLIIATRKTRLTPWLLR